MDETYRAIMEYQGRHGIMPKEWFLPFDKWQQLRIELQERLLPKTIVLADKGCDHRNFLFFGVPMCIEPSTITKEAFMAAAW